MVKNKLQLFYPKRVFKLFFVHLVSYVKLGKVLNAQSPFLLISDAHIPKVRVTNPIQSVN